MIVLDRKWVAVFYGALVIGICIAGWQRWQLGRLAVDAPAERIEHREGWEKAGGGENTWEKIRGRFEALDPDQVLPDNEFLEVARSLASASDGEIAAILDPKELSGALGESLLHQQALAEFAERDLEAALDLAFEAERGSSSMNAFGLLLRFAAEQPDGAARWLDEIRESGDATTSKVEELQQAIDQGVLRGEMQRDPVAAATRIATAERGDPSSCAPLLDRIGAEHWAGIAEVGAVEAAEGRLIGDALVEVVAQSMLAELGPDAAWARIGSLGLDEDVGAMLSRSLVFSDLGPDTARRLDTIVAGFPSGDERDAEALELAGRWIRTSPADAADWLVRQSAVPDDALKVLMLKCNGMESRTVVTLRIVDPVEREVALARIQKQWERVDPEAAEAFFAAFGGGGPSAGIR